MAWVAKNLVRGRIGRMWMATRDMDIAAEIIGIRPMSAKLSAFAVSSFIIGIAGIRHLTSLSTEQVSQITVEFELGTDVDLAANDVRDRVARARGRLPDDVKEPIVAKRSSDASPIMWVALYGAGAGLISDGGWRIFCHISNPAHVLAAHGLAVGVERGVHYYAMQFIDGQPLDLVTA